MQAGSRRPRRVLTGEEHDVHTRWRRLLCSNQRPGVTAAVKRRTRRRERRELARELDRGDL
jgi:hypothetical protein